MFQDGSGRWLTLAADPERPARRDRRATATPQPGTEHSPRPATPQLAPGARPPRADAASLLARPASRRFPAPIAPARERVTLREAFSSPTRRSRPSPGASALAARRPPPVQRTVRFRKPGQTARAQLKATGRLDRPSRLPLDGFTYSLTLSSKCFSTFPHGTCSLSVSRPYLALDGVYHPLWAAFPNNPTLRRRKARAPAAAMGLTPALGWGLDQKDAGGRRHGPERILYATIPCTRGARIQRWALPASLAVTEGILVSFFSSA